MHNFLLVKVNRFMSLNQYGSVNGFVRISFGFYCDRLSFFTQTLWLPWVIYGKIWYYFQCWLTLQWTPWNNLLSFDWSISSDVLTSPVTESLHLALNSKTYFWKNAKMCRALTRGVYWFKKRQSPFNDDCLRRVPC